MAEKDIKKTPAATQTVQPSADKYTIQELENASTKVFGVPRECAVAALCFNFSCMKRAIEKSKFNSTFLEEAMEIQCMISCGVIMLMIDTTTISIVCCNK